MPKQIESKLDQYQEQLLEMENSAPPHTLAEMQAWLKAEGLVVVQSTISRYLASLRSQRDQEHVLELIGSGAAQCREIDQAFTKNPAPQLESAINVFKLLIMQLATKGATDPAMLKMADQLMRTALEFVSGQTKALHKERELKLAEDKFQIEFCELILDKTTREAAERIANSNMSNADKIAAMRRETFKSVDELQASGKVVIPKV